MNNTQLLEAKRAAESQILAIIKGFHEATGLAPRFCLLLDQQTNDAGEITGIGDMKVSLRLDI